MPPVRHSRDLQAIRTAFNVPGIQGTEAVAQLLADSIAFVYPGVGGLAQLRGSQVVNGTLATANVLTAYAGAAGTVRVIRGFSVETDDPAGLTIWPVLQSQTAVNAPIGPAQAVAVNVPVTVNRPIIWLPGEAIGGISATAPAAGQRLILRLSWFELPDSALFPTL